MMSTNFLFSKVPEVNRQKVEFSLMVKVMGSNPGYLLNFFLLYKSLDFSMKLNDSLGSD